MRFLISIVLLVPVFLSSCIQQKNIVYFESVENDSTLVSQAIEYKVQPDDILRIETKSLSNDEFNYYLNKTDNRQSSNFNEASLAINGFLVDKNGNIELPYIGDVMVSGLTISQIEDTLNMKLRKYLKDVFVTVRLTNFRITLVGEINVPGTITFFNSKVTIFEAISRAGDITDYGNKNIVKLIRQHGDERKTYDVNLTNVSVLNSDLLYLQPNDIIYITPVKGKFFRENLPVYSFILSSVTTFVLLLSYISVN